ncbi:fimbrial biogenesis chaperone [Halobacteriovorax sp. DPLXC-1]|uniref:fimbrial biogenesis chaperone n=1 Tax=Halobacteriovorax sp. DPLXC-1 TaxID=3110771 RepID=UPI002FF147F9
MKQLVLLVFLPLLFSFTFRPTTQTIDINKKQKSTQFLIENTTDEIIPVTVKGFLRLQKSDGKEDLPVTNDISVFPPQLIISPGERKTIRVDWKGPSSLEVERVYRVVAEQVPLKLKNGNKKDSGGIKMLLKYMNVVYVPPKNPSSKLEAIKYEVKGEWINVHLRNSGNVHQYIKNLNINFEKNGKTFSISRKQLDKLNGQNILAKTTRVFKFKNTLKIPSNYKVSIKFDKI